MGMMLEEIISVFEPFVGPIPQEKKCERKELVKKKKEKKNSLANNPHTQSINNPPPNQLPITPHTRRLN